MKRKTRRKDSNCNVITWLNKTNECLVNKITPVFFHPFINIQIIKNIFFSAIFKMSTVWTTEPRQLKLESNCKLSLNWKRLCKKKSTDCRSESWDMENCIIGWHLKEKGFIMKSSCLGTTKLLLKWNLNIFKFKYHL